MRVFANACVALVALPVYAGIARAQVPAADSAVVTLPQVTVSTTRAGERAPIARSMLGRSELRERNWGQDTPMVLATLPGAYAYSDAGNGIGYSYLSIRGFPQRRISVLVNGVPLNDPESHEVYWIDHPDLIASAAEVQVQRGVGSALYGAASVGGSVHLETAPMSERPSASAAVSLGSRDTKRLMLEGRSGSVAGGWNFYGRYSRIETLGYRDQSWSKLWSYALSAQRNVGSHVVRANLYGGPEETHLAYLGVPRPYLEGAVTGDSERDRRFNPLTYANERDHFFEPHYELIHSWAASPVLALTQTLFWFDGKGYYDEQRSGRSLADYRLTPWATSDTTMFARGYYRDADDDGVLDRDGSGRAIVERADLVRRRTVVNRHFGWVPRARWQHAGGSLTVGGELRAHDGRHYGEVISGSGLPPGTAPNHSYYDYHPRTFSGGLFVREELPLGNRLLVTGDLAWRHQSYAMRGDRFDAIRFDQPYDFALPRLGLTWTPRTDVTAFASWAQSSREPSFRSLYDAEGVGSVPLFHVDAGGRFTDPLLRPERVNDAELGGTWRSGEHAATVNVFRLDFRDELVDYQFNSDLGYAVPANAAHSVHQGIELAGRTGGTVAHGLGVTIDANATLSDNHFVDYVEEIDAGFSVDHAGKTIGFFPRTLANLMARVTWRGAGIGAEVQHAGRIYLDNNEDATASIAPRTILNLTGTCPLPLRTGGSAQLGLRVLNALDARYEAGGYMDFDASGAYVPHFVPAARRTMLGELRVNW